MAQSEQPVKGVTPTGEEQKIHLRVLSPGAGVPETIEIRDVPLSTTVEQLKSRITLVAPSHPPLNSQRLIFAGRLLADNNAILQNALGAEAVSRIMVSLFVLELI